jgi:hypothetical protein
VSAQSMYVIQHTALLLEVLYVHIPRCRSCINLICEWCHALIEPTGSTWHVLPQLVLYVDVGLLVRRCPS